MCVCVCVCVCTWLFRGDDMHLLRHQTILPDTGKLLFKACHQAAIFVVREIPLCACLLCAGVFSCSGYSTRTSDTHNAPLQRNPAPLRSRPGSPCYYASCQSRMHGSDFVNPASCSASLAPEGLSAALPPLHLCIFKHGGVSLQDEPSHGSVLCVCALTWIRQPRPANVR